MGIGTRRFLFHELLIIRKACSRNLKPMDAWQASNKGVGSSAHPYGTWLPRVALEILLRSW